MSGGFRLAELAERFGLELRGDATQRIDGVSTMARATAHQLTFLANPAYRKQLAGCQAGAVVLHPREAEGVALNLLISGNPYADYARIASLFEPSEPHAPGIHPSAVVEASASVDPTATIGAHAYVGARTRVAAGARIGPGCVIGEDCEVGETSVLVARVTLVRRVRLGQRVLIHPGAVLGADGFGLAHTPAGWIKVPQLGGVVVGDDSEIGANTTIDRGALDDTVLEADVRLDNQIQVGHNVVIGAHTAIAGCTAIAGSARIGRNCLIAGGVGISGHLEIADGTRINAMTLVSHSIREAGEFAGASPMQEVKTWRRNAVRLRQLDAWSKKIQMRNKDNDDE